MMLAIPGALTPHCLRLYEFSGFVSQVKCNRSAPRYCHIPFGAQDQKDLSLADDQHVDSPAEHTGHFATQLVPII
jgi:hypothetical protein